MASPLLDRPTTMPRVSSTTIPLTVPSVGPLADWGVPETEWTLDTPFNPTVVGLGRNRATWCARTNAAWTELHDDIRTRGAFTQSANDARLALQVLRPVDPDDVVRLCTWLGLALRHELAWEDPAAAVLRVVVADLVCGTADRPEEAWTRVRETGRMVLGGGNLPSTSVRVLNDAARPEAPVRRPALAPDAAQRALEGFLLGAAAIDPDAARSSVLASTSTLTQLVPASFFEAAIVVLLEWHQGRWRDVPPVLAAALRPPLVHLTEHNVLDQEDTAVARCALTVLDRCVLQLGCLRAREDFHGLGRARRL